jgi:hypothetical protein
VANLRALRQVQANWGQQVADLWGVAYTAPQLRVERGLQSSTGAIAQGGPNGIVFDRKALRGMSRADLRSVYVHEATHALGIGAGTPTRHFENMADASTYVLAPYDNPGWAPRDAVVRLANRQGLSPVATAPNRPKAGGNPGSKRNTGANARSGNNGLLPSQPPATAVLPPGQSAAFTAQMAALQSQYSQQLAAIKLQAGSVRSQRVAAFADIKANRVQGAVAAEGDALSRGIVGSSADLGARAGVVAEAAGARVDTRTASGTALAQLRINQMQANSDYSMGIAGVMADKAAAQAELANSRYQNGLIGEALSSFDDLYQAALKRLLARGKNPAGVDPRAGATPNPTNYPNGYPPPAPARGYDLYHTPGLGFSPGFSPWAIAGRT